jgi:hypothetical protein
VRDLRTEPGWPEAPLVWRVNRWVEERAVTRSARLVVVSPGQKATYLSQLPRVDPGHIEVIANGFDEELFASVERECDPAKHAHEALRLIHSGIMYPDCRDPSALFEAVRLLAAAGRMAPASHRLVLRASGQDEVLRELAATHGVEGFVSLEPPLPYREALREMLDADALLLFQGRNCNTAIPAKLYEYIRARRPVLGLTEPDGATGREMRAAGYDLIASLESCEQITRVLDSLLTQLESREAFVPTWEQTQAYSRRASSQRLAQVFDSVTRHSS